jgi:ribosomal protein S18 acetylase RimI-like enzyme
MSDEKELTELSPMDRARRVAGNVMQYIRDNPRKGYGGTAGLSMKEAGMAGELLDNTAEAREFIESPGMGTAAMAGLGLTGFPAKEIVGGAKSAFKIKRHSPDAYDADDYDLAMDIADKEAASASDLAKKVDMGITRDRELDSILYTPDDKIAGATWRSFDDNNYAFDVAIDPKYQGKGFGGALTDRMIDSYDEFSDIPNASMRIHVTSPVMEGMLTRRGFSVVESTPDGGSKIMAKEGAKEMM